MSTYLEELGGTATGVSIGAMLVLKEAGNLQKGAMYSMGMEMINGYRNTPILGAGNMYQLGNLYLDPDDLMRTPMTKTLPSSVLGLSDDMSRAPLTSRNLTNTATSGSALFPVLNIGFTALTGMQKYSEGGGAELGRFLIEDMYAQLYGNKASEIKMAVNNVNRAAIGRSMGLSGTITGEPSIQQYRTIAGSALLGRALPVLGAYTGANMGFGAGQAIGEGLGNMLFDGSYGLGFAGGVMGAKLGAMAGAAMTKSIPAMALSAIAVGGTMMMTEAIGDILKTGFKNNRTRGLDFAGDLSAYNTNSAVTMRQRAVQSMHKSHLNARSALGQEASFQHMNRDYFAHYRRF